MINNLNKKHKCEYVLSFLACKKQVILILMLQFVSFARTLPPKNKPLSLADDSLGFPVSENISASTSANSVLKGYSKVKKRTKWHFLILRFRRAVA